jgi:hypothetical protein
MSTTYIRICCLRRTISGSEVLVFPVKLRQPTPAGLRPTPSVMASFRGPDWDGACGSSTDVSGCPPRKSRITRPLGHVICPAASAGLLSAWLRRMSSRHLIRERLASREVPEQGREQVHRRARLLRLRWGRQGEQRASYLLKAPSRVAVEVLADPLPALRPAIRSPASGSSRHHVGVG